MASLVLAFGAFAGDVVLGLGVAARCGLVVIRREGTKPRPGPDPLEQHGATGAVELEQPHPAAASEPLQRVELLLEFRVGRRAELQHRAASIRGADRLDVAVRGWVGGWGAGRGARKSGATRGRSRTIPD